ncbi:hypothetical protein HZC34_07265 [Candidatus Saganbacteria bacterium]|nr:hypothetical protein [Candidatus Saganbacteria bacterium]
MMHKLGLMRPLMHALEVRTPITPADMGDMIKKSGLHFLVQRSPFRVFQTREFKQAGAEIVTELGKKARVVFNVKQIPPDFLFSGMVGVNFSHVTKGQPENMEYLDAAMRKGSSICDIEYIVDPNSEKRLVAFGRFAGMVGMIDTLHVLGKRLDEEEGISTPFAKLMRPHQYSNLAAIKEHLKQIGDEIRANGLPDTLMPLIIGFTGGSGRCACGALEIFNALNPAMLRPRDILTPGFVSALPRNTIYGISLERVGEDGRYVRTDGRPSLIEDLDADPMAYESTLPRYLDLFTVLVHSAPWNSGQPVLVSNGALSSRKTNTLRAIGDVSCDIWPKGPMECTPIGTKPQDPFIVYNPQDGSYQMGFRGKGIVVNACETMPCLLPYDASVSVSEMLKPFIPAFANASLDGQIEGSNLPIELQKAFIVWNGQISAGFGQDYYPEMHRMLGLYRSIYSEGFFRIREVLAAVPAVSSIYDQLFDPVSEQLVRFKPEEINNDFCC